MTTLVLETDPVASRVEVSVDRLVVELGDGRTITVPLEWFPRLAHGTGAERANWRLLADGYAIEWPDLDEHVGVEGLLAGRGSGESEQSLRRWLDGRRARESGAGA
jgi:hypothetical protein